MYCQRSEDDRPSDQTRSEDQRRTEAYVSACTFNVFFLLILKSIWGRFVIRKYIYYVALSLEGIHADAYKAFQMSRDLEAVVRRFLPNLGDKPCASNSPLSRNKVAISLMTPVLPMLVYRNKSTKVILYIVFYNIHIIHIYKINKILM